MDGQDERGGGAGLGHFLDNQAQRQEPHFLPAVLLGEIGGKKPVFPKQFHHIRGEFPFFVPFRRTGSDLILGQAADHILQHELFFGQTILHGLTS